MDDQEAFNKVVRHLLTQKKRAVGCDGCTACRYRTNDGLRCAIGCLIPDDLYDASMENLGVNTLKAFRPPIAQLFRDIRHHNLLENLQEIHDQELVESWHTHLYQVGKNFGFNLDVFKELTA